jgi:hypothetical protein
MASYNVVNYVEQLTSVDQHVYWSRSMAPKLPDAIKSIGFLFPEKITLIKIIIFYNNNTDCFSWFIKINKNTNFKKLN